MAPLRSLRALTIAFLLLFLAATGIAGVATYGATHRAIVTLVDKRIALAGDEVVGERGGDAATLLARIARLAARRDTGDIGFELRDAHGARLGGNVVLPRAWPAGRVDLHRGDGIAGLSAGRALTRPAGDGLTLTVIAETEPFDNYGPERLRLYAIGFGSIVLVVLGGTALFAVMIGRRIAALRRTAEAIVDGDLGRRVPVMRGGGAFAEEARAFNRMLDRIEALVADIANVSNDVAHDLRTPLARLRARIARLTARAEAAPFAGELDTALDECDALLAMFAAVLRVAEVESGARRAGFARVALDALVAEIAETMAPAAEESGRTLVAGPCAAVTIEGDRQLLAQALVNLVENAIRHTPRGTRITLSLTRAGERASLSVADDGPGIPAAERATALRRFGRLDRNRTVGGHGLGLPLAAAVAALHHGIMTLDDARPGLAATIALPVVADGN